MIVISIACMVGITPVLYVGRDVALAIGYLVGSTIGAFTGALLTVVSRHLVRRDYDRR